MEKQPDPFLAFIPVKMLGPLCVYLIKLVFIEFNELEMYPWEGRSLRVVEGGSAVSLYGGKDRKQLLGVSVLSKD